MQSRWASTNAMGACGSLARGQDLEVWAVERCMTLLLSFLSKEEDLHKMISIQFVQNEYAQALGNMVQDKRA